MNYTEKIKRIAEYLGCNEGELVSEMLPLLSLAKQDGVTEERSRWINQPANEHDNKIRAEVVGKIGAKLLARHSPQIVLDAYFDIANEELENETNN